MLETIFSLYLKGLLGATLLTVLYLTAWVLLRRVRKRDKTKAEQRKTFFDALILAFVSIPILSFAFMAILIMMKA